MTPPPAALWPLACCSAAGHAVVLGWTPEPLGRLLPFVHTVMQHASAHRHRLAHLTVAATYLLHAATVQWHHTGFKRSRAPPAFLALAVAGALLTADGCLASVDPAVTLPEHRLLARAGAVGGTALFAHLLCS